MQEDFTAKIVTLNEVYSATHELARLVMQSSLSFDIVIAIARGGMLPARLICDFLNIDRLTSIQIKHYKSGAEALEQAEIIDPVKTDISHKNILLIDDVNDSGKTLKKAVEHVQSLKPALLKTAVLHEKKNTVFKTDFTVEKLDEWKWLVYEWAVTEDILDFLKKDNMLEQSAETAREHLARKYDLHIEEPLFNAIMQMKENYF